MPPGVTLCTEIQSTLVFIECCHQTKFTKQSVLSNLANSARASCLPQRGPLHISGNLSQTCPQYQTEPSNCQLHLARGYITSRGPHVHDFPALSSEHLQLHQQNATQAQCQDGRHPTKKTSYCLWRMTSIL